MRLNALYNVNKTRQHTKCKFSCTANGDGDKRQPTKDAKRTVFSVCVCEFDVSNSLVSAVCVCVFCFLHSFSTHSIWDWVRMIQIKLKWSVYLNSAACKKLNELATIKCRQHANYHTYCHYSECVSLPLWLSSSPSLLLLTNMENDFVPRHIPSKMWKFNHEFLYSNDLCKQYSR